MNSKKPNNSDFDINSFEERLQAKNAFDGNLAFGAKKFHAETNRSGKGKPSSGYLIREHAKVVNDTGVDRYQRNEGYWEDVDQCPVCGSTERDHFLSRFGLDIYSCAECSHKYLHPRVTFEAATELYKDDKTASDIYTQPLQVGIDETKYQYGLDLVEKLSGTKRDKILDLGCGAGTYLKMAERNGWKQCVGVDINERYSEIYSNASGIQFINASFESLDHTKLGSDYDVIAMWSVLEHLYDKHDVLTKLKELLRPGGLLFILVPNVKSLATRLMREMSPTFAWKHLSHFTPESLTRLMDIHGLEKIFHETVISEVDNIKSYMSGEYPYHGYGDPDGIFDFITPEYLHKNMLGSRQIAVFKKPE